MLSAGGVSCVSGVKSRTETLRSVFPRCTINTVSVNVSIGTTLFRCFGVIYVRGVLRKGERLSLQRREGSLCAVAGGREVVWMHAGQAVSDACEHGIARQRQCLLLLLLLLLLPGLLRLLP